MNQRILFVDDEPNVLGGLRRMLRPLRHEWDTEFAEGGAEALAVLEKERFDVIVSDMRMPGMTGDQLLDEVRNRYPHMVRIVLTGQCDKDSGLRALRVAHRMLNKPCNPDTLKHTVASTCCLQNLLMQESIRALVTHTASISSLPSLYAEVMTELDDVEPSLEQARRHHRQGHRHVGQNHASREFSLLWLPSGDHQSQTSDRPARHRDAAHVSVSGRHFLDLLQCQAEPSLDRRPLASLPGNG